MGRNVTWPTGRNATWLSGLRAAEMEEGWRAGAPVQREAVLKVRWRTGEACRGGDAAPSRGMHGCSDGGPPPCSPPGAARQQLLPSCFAATAPRISDSSHVATAASRVQFCVSVHV